MHWVSIWCRWLIASPFRSGLLLTLFAACPRPLPPQPPPTPPPPPPPIVVPEGCLENLSGEWTHAEDPSFHYAGEDDGGTLTLVVHREFPDAGGFRPRRFVRDAGARVERAPGPGTDAGVDAGGDAGPSDSTLDGDAGALEPGPDGGAPTLEPLATPVIVLQRTPRGFVGLTSATVQHPTGRSCTAAYPTELVACADGGLLLRTRSAIALGDTCEAPASPGPVVTAQHRLIRPVPDAGSPDGGWRAWARQSSEARADAGAPTERALGTGRRRPR